MRNWLLALLAPAILGGCATGYVTDWFRDRSSIVNPQLLRYGFTVPQSRCVSQRMGQRLSIQELRQFQENAAAVQPAGGAQLTLANLRAVAGGVRNREVLGELDLAVRACGVPPTPVLAAAPAPAAGARPAPGGGMTSGGVPVDFTARPAAPATTWLNLGAAASGQSIAIDASSIRQEGASRTAWFRMTDPESGAPTTNNYRLRIDCQARTVQPLALRQTDAEGAQVSLREYGPEEAKAGAAESGTVLEIAYLSLCT